MEQGAEVLGTLPEPIRKIWMYCEEMRSRLRELIEQEEKTDSRKEARELQQTIDRLKVKYDLCSRILWQEIYHEFQDGLDRSKGTLAICEGWLICRKAPTPLADMLSRMG